MTATNDHEYRFNGFVGGPLSDKVLGSVSIYGNQRDFPITNIANGDKTDQDNVGARGKLVVKPNEALDITLSADYQKSRSHGANYVYTYLTPGAYLLLGTPPPPLPPPILNTLSQGAVLAGIAPSQSNKYINTPISSGSDLTDNIYSANIDYRLGDVTLSSTTAYQRETQYNIQDLLINSSFYSNNFRDAFASIIGAFPGSPGTWADFSNLQTQIVLVQQTSQEFRLVSSPHEPFNYVAGLFFSNQLVDLKAVRTLTPAATDYDVNTSTKTYDAYARSTWKFAPSTSLITGLRFNHDVLSYRYDQLGAGVVHTANSDDSNAEVGDVTVQQQLHLHSMAYATYARGYAPRVFNTGAYSGSNAASPTAPLPVTGQEHIDHFEIGSKGTYLDQRLQFDASAFYTVYRNYQIQTSQSIPGQIGPILGLTPAGKARTEGVEIDTAFAATATTRIGLDLAFIDAKFLDYTGAPCYGNGVALFDGPACHDLLDKNGIPTGSREQDVSGKTMPNSPEFKGTLFAEQRLPFGGSQYEGVIGGNYAYRSSAQFQPDQNPETVQGAFGMLNLAFSVKEITGKFMATAFVNNVADRHYFVDLEDFWSGPWGSNAVVGQPARDSARYYGLRLSTAF